MTEAICSSCGKSVSVSPDRDRSLRVYCAECRLTTFENEIRREPLNRRARRIAERFAKKLWGAS